MKPLNASVRTIPPSGIRRFFDLAASRADVISLGVGEPDFVTPWHIREAAIYAIEHGHTTYTANAGALSLRRAVCADLRGRYGVDYDPEREIVITVGVSEGLDLALRTLLSPGDEVVLFEPCYVSYDPCVRLAGGMPVSVPTSASDGFRYRPDLFESAISPRTKAVLLCSPGNPTGALQAEADLRAIVSIAERHDLYILTDEIYSRLIYGRDHTCVAALPGAWQRTILLNGLSKSHAMTGWRVAHVCAPEAICAEMLKIHQYVALCAPHVSQMAALEALTSTRQDTEEMVAEYDRRRRYLCRELTAMGLDCPEPDGAFYVFPSVRRTGLSAVAFAEGLLKDAGVAVVPGDVFGPSGEGHVRCSYAAAFPLLEQAIGRLRQFTGALSSGAARPTGAKPLEVCTACV